MINVLMANAPHEIVCTALVRGVSCFAKLSHQCFFLLFPQPGFFFIVPKKIRPSGEKTRFSDDFVLKFRQNFGLRPGPGRFVKLSPLVSDLGNQGGNNC